MNSDNNRGNEIEEDVPQYRSVMIGGPLSAPPMPRSFASMGPAKAKMAPRSMQQLKPRISQATIWNVAELRLGIFQLLFTYKKVTMLAHQGV